MREALSLAVIELKGLHLPLPRESKTKQKTTLAAGQLACKYNLNHLYAKHAQLYVSVPC